MCVLTRRLWHSTDFPKGAAAACSCPAIHKGKSTVNKIGFFLTGVVWARRFSKRYSPASRSGGWRAPSAPRSRRSSRVI
jgi:hypothetical protein